jgi:hypothetical protein
MVSRKWFLNDDTNKSDEPDPTTQPGRFQVIKSSELKDSTQHFILAIDMGEQTYYILLDVTPYYNLWKDR